MNIRSAIIMILLTISACESGSGRKGTMITFDKIEEFYSNMHKNGVNTDTLMLYGYFFTNSTPEKLEMVAEELKGQDFKYVDIYQDEDNLYWLHMERTEIHNSKSLFELNQKLYSIADKYQIESYDGFDVGNAAKDKAIDRDTYVVPEEFKMARIDIDNKPMLLIGNSAFENFPHKSEFCHFVEMNCRYKAKDESMLPQKGDLNKMDKLDYSIEKQFVKSDIRYYYVFRQTYNGLRQVYYVVNDSDKVAKAISKMNLKSRDFSIEFKIRTDKEWKLYKEFSVKLPKE
jgi:hypothetical protein